MVSQTQRESPKERKVSDIEKQVHNKQVSNPETMVKNDGKASNPGTPTQDRSFGGGSVVENIWKHFSRGSLEEEQIGTQESISASFRENHALSRARGSAYSRQ